MGTLELAFTGGQGTKLFRALDSKRQKGICNRHGQHKSWPSVNQGPTRLVTVCALSPDPWSVSTLDATNLFASSLFPYLGFLWALGKTKCPRLAVNGFRFLLVFVAATIPAGIYAKVAYNDILANVDWLHGTAESFLTITNLLILLGLKTELPKNDNGLSTNEISGLVLAVAAWAGLTFAGLPIASPHMQPANALSIPTWIIHVSSLIEWLFAMDLVWDRAALTGNEKWKGLTWGMLPLHTSGLLACTYHLFYNAPNLDFMVTLQAALTCAGNATMGIAAYRIMKEEERMSEGDNVPVEDAGESDGTSVAGSGGWASDLAQVTIISIVASLLLRDGTLFLDFPFQPSLQLALGIVGTLSMVNVSKWALRSNSSTA